MGNCCSQSNGKLESNFETQDIQTLQKQESIYHPIKFIDDNDDQQNQYCDITVRQQLKMKSMKQITKSNTLFSNRFSKFQNVVSTRLIAMNSLFQNIKSQDQKINKLIKMKSSKKSKQQIQHHSNTYETMLDINYSSKLKTNTSYDDQQTTKNQGLSRLTEFNNKLNQTKKNQQIDKEKLRNQFSDVFNHLYDGSIKEHYKVIDKLGIGKYGSVYKVKSTITKSVRVMKVFEKNKMDDKARKQLIFEVIANKKIDHPNITKYYDSIQNNNEYYLIMEELQGQELFQAVKQKKNFTEDEAKEYVTQLLQLIDFFHKKKIILREIRPDNVYLIGNQNQHLQIKLKDLKNIVRMGDDKNKRFKKKVGNPYFLAPEMIKQSYNKEVDLWQLGVLVYTLIIGTPPFNGNDVSEIQKNIVEQELKFDNKEWEDLSEQVKDFCRRLLVKDPQQRMDIKQAINHDWFNSQSFKIRKNLVNKTLMINLSKFQVSSQLNNGLLNVMAEQFLKPEEQHRIRKTFSQLDVDNSGSLNMSELIQGFNQIVKDKDKSIQYVQNVFSRLGLDENAKIDYKQFMVATMDYEKFINNYKIQQIFQIFDFDGSGSISKKEFVNALQLNAEQQDQWNQLLETIDENNDDQLDLKEFMNLFRNQCK